MEVRNCKNCGRLFNYMGAGSSKICPACAQALEEVFNNVKKYIEENPGANIDIISKECDVSVQQLTQWVRQERLTFSEDSPITVECESCGKPIRSGRFCEECSNRMARGLNDAFKKKPMPELKKHEKDGNKMRFLDK